MTKAEWLALPLIVRVWRVLFCHHPWDKSRKIGVVRHAERDHVGYHFVVNVRQCGRCCDYFLDAGLEDVSDAPIWWCSTHGREATFVDERGARRCDPSLGGILLPCSVTRKESSDEHATK